MNPYVNITEHRIYQCDICGSLYRDLDKAQACAAQPTTWDEDLKVGDLVITYPSFGWCDDEAWVLRGDDERVMEIIPSLRDEPLDDRWTLSPIYVVTAMEVDRCNLTQGWRMFDEEQRGEVCMDKHRMKYHLFTLAFEGGYRSGYTFSGRDHHPPYKLKNPPELPQDVIQSLIGKRAGNLL
jgi:hypothetical protein